MEKRNNNMRMLEESESDRMILGEGAIFSTDSEKTGINNNAVIVGSSGSGKTVSLTEPKILETRNRNLIVTVTKRRIVEKYAPVLRKRGYQVWDLNFVDPKAGNVGFDLMDQISAYTDIPHTAKSIVYADKKGNFAMDPYWDKAATSLLSAEMAYIRETKGEPTFNDLLEFHDNLNFTSRNGLIYTNHDYLFEDLEEKDPSCYAVRCWKTFHSVPIKTAGCIFSSLNTMLDEVFTPELRSMFTMKKRVNFDELATQKTVLFITTSPVNPAINTFIAMFYSIAFKRLFELAEKQPDKRLPIPVDFLADDFATGGKVDAFQEHISVFREKGISTTIMLQSESQLSSMYGEDGAQTIINNCDTYVYLGGMDLNTCRNISLKANMPLEDVLYMPVGSEIIFRRGQKPIYTERYHTLEDERYRKITDAYEQHIEKMKNKEH